MPIDLFHLLALLDGAVLGAVFVVYARRPGPDRERTIYALALVVAALVYLGFALWAGDRDALVAEIIGLGAFSLLAALARPWHHALALAWVAHVVWDLALHSASHPGHAPGWYPVACVGFDLVVAGAALRAGFESQS